MYRVRCKACRQVFDVSDGQVGQPIQCVHCGNPILIRPVRQAGLPAATTATPSGLLSSRDTSPLSTEEEEAVVLSENAGESGFRDSASADSAGSVRQARRVEAIFILCRSCGQRIQISARDAGQVVRCEACRGVMKVELPTAQIVAGVAALPESDPLEEWFASASLPDADVPLVSRFRRRALRRRTAGEKVFIGAVAILLLAGLGRLIHYFRSQGPSPLRAPPPAAAPSVSPVSQPAVAPPIVDTDSWVDAENPVVWDRFLDATWGAEPSSLPGLVPTDPPSDLFDGGNLRWYTTAQPPPPIGKAEIRSLLYAFLLRDGRLRLCEIQVYCRGNSDSELLRERLEKRYGPAQDAENPLAAVEWRGRTSAGREVLIEMGGKTESFDGTQIRAALQGIH